MRPEGNYLSRLDRAEKTYRPRRTTNLDGAVYFMKRGVRGYTSQRCKVLNISESGCQVKLTASVPVPEHLYLVLDLLKAKFPCAILSRCGEELNIRFAKEIPTDTVDALAEMRFAQTAFKAAPATE